MEVSTMNIQGSKALVTGGSEGIGLAVARALIAKGGQVAILSRTEKKVRAAAEELGAHPVIGDVGVEADAVRAVAETVKALGGLDILVNNAGFGRFTDLVDMDVADFDAVFTTNVRGAMLMGREAARVFVKQGSGHLINVSSTSGLRGGAKSTAYSGSKFALRGMTECWRAELRPHNVRVMLVNPSEVQTEFFAKVGAGDRPFNEKKLRGQEIADAIVGALAIDDRGFIPEFSVFATNPW
jgi:3-oxoacyl-[acyl-carrier protein] reductase